MLGLTTCWVGLQALLIAGGGIAGGARLQLVVKAAQKEQQQLCLDVQDKAGRVRQPKVAVDVLFARRLLKILQMYALCSLCATGRVAVVA